MWNWNKLQETGDFSYLFPLSKYRLLKLKTDNSEKSKLISDKTYNSFIKHIGLNDDYNKLLALKQEYVDRRCEWLIKTDYPAKMKSKFLAIDIESLEEKIKNTVSSTVRETTIFIQKNAGSNMGINNFLKKINPIEFNEYINYFIKNKNV